MSQTLSKHVPNTFQTLSNMSQTLSNMSQTLSKHFPNMSQTLSKHFQTCPKHFPNTFQTCPKHVPDTSHTCSHIQKASVYYVSTRCLTKSSDLSTSECPPSVHQVSIMSTKCPPCPPPSVHQCMSTSVHSKCPTTCSNAHSSQRFHDPGQPWANCPYMKCDEWNWNDTGKTSMAPA